MFLSSSEVKGKLPPLPTWNRADTIVSFMAGPDGKACHLASIRAFHQAFPVHHDVDVFWPDQAPGTPT